MDMSPASIEREFAINIPDSWDTTTPWYNFINGTNVHLGKRSGGWKFCWNFNDKKYYSNKEELFAFIRSGRIVDEYGTEWAAEAFIKMALEWGQPDGAIYNKEYEDEQYRRNGYRPVFGGPEHYNYEIDGLVVSKSTEFS